MQFLKSIDIKVCVFQDQFESYGCLRDFFSMANFPQPDGFSDPINFLSSFQVNLLFDIFEIGSATITVVDSINSVLYTQPNLPCLAPNVPLNPNNVQFQLATVRIRNQIIITQSGNGSYRCITFRLGFVINVPDSFIQGTPLHARASFFIRTIDSNNCRIHNCFKTINIQNQNFFSVIGDCPITEDNPLTDMTSANVCRMEMAGNSLLYTPVFSPSNEVCYLVKITNESGATINHEMPINNLSTIPNFNESYISSFFIKEILLSKVETESEHQSLFDTLFSTNQVVPYRLLEQNSNGVVFNQNFLYNLRKRYFI